MFCSVPRKARTAKLSLQARKAQVLSRANPLTNLRAEFIEVATQVAGSWPSSKWVYANSEQRANEPGSAVRIGGTAQRKIEQRRKRFLS